MEEVRSDNIELKEEFNKMNDRFSSLQLEYQVDKSQHKVQLDNLAYQLALVSSSKPHQSFSSTSGVKSDEDPDDLDKVGSLAFLDLKENIQPNTKEAAKTSK